MPKKNSTAALMPLRMRQDRRARIEALIQNLIDILDTTDGDPDAEIDDDGDHVMRNAPLGHIEDDEHSYVGCPPLRHINPYYTGDVTEKNWSVPTKQMDGE